MSREDINKLLGGYATGTLTPEEQQTLFEAALEDQELFDAMAAEQPLRDLLGDPTARAHLLAAIDEAPAPWYRGWWRQIPVAILTAAILAFAVVSVWQRVRPAPPLRIAKLEFPAPSPVTIPAPTLPPPPAVTSTVPPMTPLRLPALAPPAPPLADVIEAPAKDKKIVVSAGSVQTIDGLASAPALALNDRTQSGRGFLGNSFLPPSPVVVPGTVTDPSGAGIPTATVLVKSLQTGEVERPSINEKGQFNAAELPGQKYELTAMAPGFQARVIESAVPPDGAPSPIDFRLDIGAMTETVAVSADSRIAGGRGGRGGGGGGRSGAVGGVVGVSATAAPMARKADAQAGSQSQQGQQGQQATLQSQQSPMQSQQQQRADAAEGAVFAINGSTSGGLPVAPLEVKCRLLRQAPGGEPVEVAADGAVPAGSTLLLRITPNADGFVRVTRAGHTYPAQVAHPSQVFDLALGKFTKRERVDLQIQFSNGPIDAKPTSVSARSAAVRANPPEQVTIAMSFNVQ